MLSLNQQKHPKNLIRERFILIYFIILILFPQQKQRKLTAEQDRIMLSIAYAIHYCAIVFISY